MKNYMTINIRHWVNKKDKSMEAIILNCTWDYYTAQKAYEYARFVLKKRWKNGENKILTSPYYSYLYARYVIQGRWRKAEPIIAKFPKSAYSYAKYVLKGRFIQSENNKDWDVESIYLYSRYILKNRWKEKENKFLDLDRWSSWSSYQLVKYIKYVIKNRWEKAEPIILKGSWIADYVKILKGDQKEDFNNKILARALVEKEPYDPATKYLKSQKV